jgi:hypothetical protein
MVLLALAVKEKKTDDQKEMFTKPTREWQFESDE